MSFDPRSSSSKQGTRKKEIVMIKACIFDLDGTLSDTIADIADSGNYALERNGFLPYPEKDYCYFCGSGFAPSFKECWKSSPITPSSLNRCWRTTAANMPPITWIKPALIMGFLSCSLFAESMEWPARWYPISPWRIPKRWYPGCLGTGHFRKYTGTSLLSQ